MKKNHAYRWSFASPSLTNSLRIMKLITALMFLFVVSVSANGFSQEAKVTISLTKVKLTRLFKAIEKETDYRFAFSNDIIPLGRIVTVNVNKVPVSKVLTEVFASTRLKFRFVDESGIIIISEKTEEDFRETLIPAAVIITGKVTNTKGEPLAGVTVQVKGSSKATTTASDGSFSFDVGNNSNTLVFSYVGMESQELSISGNSNIQVQMKPFDNSMDAVVVVGYGTQKARNVTGAMGKISSKEIKEVAVVGLDQAILGRVSGVQVTENSAEPGGEVQIRIRGIASITSGSDPLVVVDGVPMSVGLNAINPNDIETIDILKDAAATAIYGSRASAGVILVTTKRGKAGKVVVAFDAYTGTQSNTKKISLLNGAQFAKLANEKLVNGGEAPNPAWSNPSAVVNTDWQNAFFRSAPKSNFNVSLSGGSDRSRSFLSLGYTNQDGIIKGSGYKRLTARINLDYDVSSRIKIRVTVNFNNDKKNNTRTQEEFWGVLLNAMRQQPTDPIYTDQTGLVGDHLYGFRGWALRRTSYNNTWYALGNPAFTGDYYKSGNENTQLLTNAFGEIELLKGLKIKSIIGYNINNSFGFYNAPYKLPTDVDPTSQAYVNQSWGNGVQWNWVNTLNYTQSFGNHNISVLAGTDALKGTGKGIFGDGQSPPEDQLSISASTRYCHLNMISDDKLKISVDRIILQSPAHVMATHVMALLGNQQPEVPLANHHLPDPIAVQSLENLIELAAMMNYN